MEVARESQRPMAKAKRQYRLKQETETNIQEGIKNRDWSRKYSSSYRKRRVNKKVSSCSSADTTAYSIGWYPQKKDDERISATRIHCKDEKHSWMSTTGWYDMTKHKHKDRHNKREEVPKKQQCPQSGAQATRMNSGRISEQLQRRGDGMSGMPQSLKQQQQMRKKRRKKERKEESASHVRLIHKRRRIQQSP